MARITRRIQTHEDDAANDFDVRPSPAPTPETPKVAPAAALAPERQASPAPAKVPTFMELIAGLNVLRDAAAAHRGSRAEQLARAEEISRLEHRIHSMQQMAEAPVIDADAQAAQRNAWRDAEGARAARLERLSKLIN